jgi:hypothetical protein
MEEIAQDHHSAGAGPDERAVQPGQVVARGADRGGNSDGLKRRAFAPVEVRHNQRAGVGPVERALGEKIDLLARKREGDIRH